VGALSEFKQGLGPGPDGPLTTLIKVIERVARAGWPETVCLIALLAVAAAAVALVVAASCVFPTPPGKRVSPAFAHPHRGIGPAGPL
jgi:hypothetical protein